MKKTEVYFLQLFTKAIEGDLAAAKLLVDMAEEHVAFNDGVGWDTEILGKSEAMQRFGKNWAKKIGELNTAVTRGLL